MPPRQLLRAVVKDLEESFDAKAFLEDRSPEKSGADWAIDCPECGQQGKRLKLHVAVEQKISGGRVRNPGTWICFFCEEDNHGSAIDLVMKLEDCSFFKAIDVLRKFSKYADRIVDVEKYIQKLLEEEPAQGLKSETPPSCALPKDFIKAGNRTRQMEFPKYFTERGIDIRMAKLHGLGFCVRGKYANRLIVPVTRKGKLAAFQGRFMRKSPPEGVKKYLNDFGSGKTSASLFGADLAKKRKASTCVLVEDNFSAMFVTKLKEDMVGVSLRGTNFSSGDQGHLSILAETGAEEIVVCLDNDASAKAEKIASVLSPLFKVRMLSLPDARDPDEYNGKEAEFLSLLSRAPVFGSSVSVVDYVNNVLGR